MTKNLKCKPKIVLPVTIRDSVGYHLRSSRILEKAADTGTDLIKTGHCGVDRCRDNKPLQLNRPFRLRWVFSKFTRLASLGCACLGHSTKINTLFCATKSSCSSFLKPGNGITYADYLLDASFARKL